jgi:hypothetical protein
MINIAGMELFLGMSLINIELLFAVAMKSDLLLLPYQVVLCVPFR